MIQHWQVFPPAAQTLSPVQTAFADRDILQFAHSLPDGWETGIMFPESTLLLPQSNRVGVPASPVQTRPQDDSGHHLATGRATLEIPLHRLGH